MDRRRHGVGRNYSGWSRGVGGPPPGAKVWVSQSWPTQTLTRESSIPLRILGLWLDEKGELCIFSVFADHQFSKISSSAHQRAIICNLSWSAVTSDGWFVHSSEVWFVRRCGIWFVHWFEVWFALLTDAHSHSVHKRAPGQRLLTCCPTKLAVPRWYWSHHYLLRLFRIPSIFQRFWYIHYSATNIWKKSKWKA